MSVHLARQQDEAVQSKKTGTVTEMRQKIKGKGRGAGRRGRTGWIRGRLETQKESLTPLPVACTFPQWAGQDLSGRMECMKVL